MPVCGFVVGWQLSAAAAFALALGSVYNQPSKSSSGGSFSPGYFAGWGVALGVGIVLQLACQVMMVSIGSTRTPGREPEGRPGGLMCCLCFGAVTALVLIILGAVGVVRCSESRSSFASEDSGSGCQRDDSECGAWNWDLSGVGAGLSAVAILAGAAALLNILVYSLQVSRAELGPQVQVSTGARSRALSGAAAAAAAPRLAALAQDAERKGAAGAAYVF